MKNITWNSSYDTGNETIDSQHRYLVDLLNELINERTTLKIAESKQILKSLIHYANVHFYEEEQLMISTNYPNYIEHKKEHQSFIEKLQELDDELKLLQELDNDGKTSHLSFQMIVFLANWLVDHITVKDKEYVQYL